MKNAFNAKEKVVYVDEVVFTKATIPTHDYALKYSNQTVDEKDFYSKYIAVIAAIAADTGVETILIFDKAVNKFDFIEFLKHLRGINGNRKLHCFIDNMKAHKGPEVIQEFERLNIIPIWNVPYRYDLQPIELVFSQVKRIYRKAKLSAFINEKLFDYKTEI